MAEVLIASNAAILTLDQYTPHPWICRDDSGNYWTIFQNLDGNIDVYKSIDSGSTWSLKKTLSNTDFTGTPFPMDSFSMLNLEGENAVYVMMRRGALWYSWEVDTLTDTGATDLNGLDSLSDGPIYIAWDKFNKQLFCNYKWTDQVRWVELTRPGSGAVDSVTKTGWDPYDFAIDSVGNKYFLGSPSDPSWIRLYDKTNDVTATFQTSTQHFANIVIRHNDDIVFMMHQGTYCNIHILEGGNISNDLTGNKYFALDTPSSCFVSVDGLGNPYVIYTNVTDNEAWYKKFDISTGSFDSAVKISANYDGIMVIPELRAPINEQQLLVTYQATQ